jgi:hypothetical protein
MPLIFESAGLYIESKSSIRDKITALDQVISSLYTAQINAVETSIYDEYLLNDGQVQVKSIYRSPDSIAKAIESYERIRERMISKYNGRSFRLMDWKNFKKRC